MDRDISRYRLSRRLILPILLPLVLAVPGCGGGGEGPAGGSTITSEFSLGLAGPLPAGSTVINGASISLTLPAGVTLSGPAASAVAASGQAAGILQAAFVNYTPATATSGARLSFLLFLVKPVSTLTGGKLATVQCALAPGAVLLPADVPVSGFVTNQLDAEIPGIGISILP